MSKCALSRARDAGRQKRRHTRTMLHAVSHIHSIETTCFRRDARERLHLYLSASSVGCGLCIALSHAMPCRCTLCVCLRSWSRWRLFGVWRPHYTTLSVDAMRCVNRAHLKIPHHQRGIYAMPFIFGTNGQRRTIHVQRRHGRVVYGSFDSINFICINTTWLCVGSDSDI